VTLAAQVHGPDLCLQWLSFYALNFVSSSRPVAPPATPVTLQWGVKNVLDQV
jgi:hypothetical protein